MKLKHTIKHNLFNTINKKKYFYYIILLALFIKFVVLFIRTFLPFGLPESWRQYDTMGVSLRYWMRWTLESFPDTFSWFQKYLLPAVLNHGDSFGIVPMEFPILNIITAPFFILGYPYGRTLAFLFIIIIVLVLTIINANVWKGRKIFGMSCYPAFLLMPIMSLGVTWSGKFMPDFISILLVCIGIGLSLKISISSAFLSVISCSIGLLMKPTSIITFMIYFGIHHFFTMSSIKDIKKWLVYRIPATLTVLLSTIISASYYYKVNPWISTYQDIPNLFYLTIQPFQKAMAEAITNASHFFLFWTETAFFLGGVFIIGFILLRYCFQSKNYRPHWAWLAMYIQMMVILMITGYQSYSHLYYFLGTLPFCCLLFMKAWYSTDSKILKHLLSIGLLIPILERASMDLKNYTDPKRKDTTYIECNILKTRNPQLPFNTGYVWRSQPELFPQIGVCFGEEQNSTISRYGLFHNRAGEIPEKCKVIDKSTNFAITDCLE